MDLNPDWIECEQVVLNFEGVLMTYKEVVVKNFMSRIMTDWTETLCLRHRRIH
jgi:hypothetical protein